MEVSEVKEDHSEGRVPESELAKNRLELKKKKPDFNNNEDRNDPRDAYIASNCVSTLHSVGRVPYSWLLSIELSEKIPMFRLHRDPKWFNRNSSLQRIQL